MDRCKHNPSSANIQDNTGNMYCKAPSEIEEFAFLE